MKPISEQVRLAFKGDNVFEAIAGLIYGCFVPVAVYIFSHYEIRPAGEIDNWFYGLLLQPKFYIVLAGLVFSAITVYTQASVAFDNKPKAFGFFILLEGVMTTSNNVYLSIAALIILMSINGLATAVNLAVHKEVTESVPVPVAIPETKQITASPTWAKKQ